MTRTPQSFSLTEVGLLVTLFSLYTISHCVAVTYFCIAKMAAIANLPASAICIGIAAIAIWNTSMGLAAAEFPFVTFVVCQTIALSCNAFVGGFIAARPTSRTVFATYTESRFRKTNVGFDFTGLPTYAITFNITFTRKKNASF